MPGMAARSGVEAGFAQRAELTLDAGAILLGNVEVIRASLTDGWVEARDLGDNKWSIAGDPLIEIQAGVLPQTPEEWLERINSVLGGVLTTMQRFDEGLALETLSFEDVDIRILTIQGEQIGAIGSAFGELSRPENDLSIQLSAEGQSMGLPELFSISLDTFDNYKSLRANADIGVIPINDLLARIGVPDADFGSMSVGTAFSAEMDRDDGLKEVGLVIAREAGTFELPWLENETISSLSAAFTYNPGEDEVAFRQLNLESTRLGGIFEGRLKNVLARNSLRQVVVETDQMRLDLRDRFEKAWDFNDVSAVIDVSDDFSILSIASLKAGLGDAVLQASGEIDFQVEHEKGEIPLTLDMAAEIVGEVQKQAVLDFWPTKLGKGARDFVIERLENGVLTEASATLSLKPDSMAQGYLRDEDLAVSFAFRNGKVRFMDDLPPVENATGTGKLSGNSFGVILINGTYDDWALQSGSVDFPALNPRGENFTVTAYGAGPAVSILRHLSDSNLRLEEETGFDPERISGDATASVKLVRPALDNVPAEDILLEARGQIKQAGLKQAVGSLDLNNGSVNVDVTLNRIILTGFGDLGTSPVQFTWRDAFDDEGQPADLSATAVVTPDVLNMFGLVGRAILTGEVPLEMQGTVGSDGLQQATFAFDLLNARIDLAEIDWIKPVGERARARLDYTGDLREQAAALRLDAETANLDGDLRLAADGQLKSLDLRRLYVEDAMDVSGRVSRTEKGGIDARLSGKYLDISNYLTEIGGVGGAAEGSNVEVSFSADVERLKLRRNLSLFDANIRVTSTEAAGLELFEAAGTTEDDGNISASLKSKGVNEPLDLVLQASDAGYLARAFLDLDFIEGGSLNLRGSLATKDKPANLVASIENARLRNAPFFTQILSLASLRGLTDTLAGDGVLFSKIEAPITIGGGRYVIDGGRASGPALGLTVNGWVGTDGKGIELDGVLVPSFGVNSVLGGVPIIGDLIVGREGEGIFSITYSVSGTLEKAQVAVNPLSAVTPGILRRIFENPSDTSIPEALPVDPDRLPPSAKLPDLPDEEILAPTPGSGG